MNARLLTLALALLAPAFLTPSAAAHDARSAAVEVRVVGSLVTVNLSATQAGLHAALESAAGRALDASDAGYQALVADHLRRTLRLSVDGAPVAVGDVGLRLGDHQSDAQFVAELHRGASELTVTVESFGGVPGHQTVVRIRQGEETTRGVLSEADGQTLSATLGGPASVVETSAVEGSVAQTPVEQATADAVRDSSWSHSWIGWALGLGLVGLAAAFPLLLIVRR